MGTGTGAPGTVVTGLVISTSTSRALVPPDTMSSWSIASSSLPSTITNSFRGTYDLVGYAILHGISAKGQPSCSLNFQASMATDANVQWRIEDNPCAFFRCRFC